MQASYKHKISKEHSYCWFDCTIIARYGSNIEVQPTGNTLRFVRFHPRKATDSLKRALFLNFETEGK